jgi:hypothetical protein
MRSTLNTTYFRRYRYRYRLPHPNHDNLKSKSNNNSIQRHLEVTQNTLHHCHSLSCASQRIAGRTTTADVSDRVSAQTRNRTATASRIAASLASTAALRRADSALASFSAAAAAMRASTGRPPAASGVATDILSHRCRHSSNE